MSQAQMLLFAEPSISETAVWCDLANGIDPAKWANLCRSAGSLPPHKFKQLETLINDFCADRPTPPKPTPLFSIGPSGINGQYQSERYS